MAMVPLADRGFISFTKIGLRPVKGSLCNKGPALTSISKSYSDVAPGEILCMFNGAGFFQISQNLGSAEEALELKSEDSIQILFYE